MIVVGVVKLVAVRDFNLVEALCSVLLKRRHELVLTYQYILGLCFLIIFICNVLVVNKLTWCINLILFLFCKSSRDYILKP